ncbi:DUF4386 domain-containing protein [Halomicroarcula sp. GCM10025817]|uniref:DUF4386 domain-containing protein n=1 Tax=Haloarcula TaxID=2237 RepID=UPI0023E80F6F|nr:DUF4386 domain-containing protein [Halomicroarcula sp. SYNS111]
MATTTAASVGVEQTPAERTISTRTIARITGLLYLLIFVTAGFSEGFVRASLIVPGDATATAANIVAAEELFRLGIASDLVAFSADAVVAVLLYVLLRPVSRTLALLAASLRLIAHPAIASINMLNQYMALQLLSGDEYLSVFSPEQIDALVLLLLTAHTYGYLIGGIFFGLHLIVLGYLLYRSTLFPAVLGGLIVLAAVGYLTESFTFFLLPAYEPVAATLVVVTAVVGEIALALYLVVKGVRTERPATQEVA